MYCVNHIWNWWALKAHSENAENSLTPNHWGSSVGKTSPQLIRKRQGPCWRTFQKHLQPDQGVSTLISHHIVLKPGCPIQKGFFWVSEQVSEMVRKEVQNMPHVWMLEELSNEWCSLIVLVPKVDKMLWFCIDFHKLRHTLCPVLCWWIVTIAGEGHKGTSKSSLLWNCEN